MHPGVYHDFLGIISEHGLTEADFETKETETYPPPGIVGPIQGTVTIKYKKSGIAKVYETYGDPWLQEFEDDLKSGFYKTRH